MKNWFREVWPPGWILVCGAITYAVAGGFAAFVRYMREGDPTGIPSEPDASALGILIFLAGLYGIYRFAAFHPLYNADYQKWLRSSPWTADIPLPFGAVHLKWQDVVLVGILTALSFLHLTNVPNIGHMPVDGRIVPWFFFTAYLAVSLLTMPLLEQFPVAAAMICIAALFGVSSHPVWQSILFLLLYGLSQFGQHRALTNFHLWREFALAEQDVVQFNESSLEKVRAKIDLGWPFDRRLSPQPRNRESIAANSMSPTFAQLASAGMSLPLLRALVWAGLMAWVTGFGGFQLLKMVPEKIPGALCFFGLVLAGIRLFVYLGGYHPPISLLGRLFTMRWIIPAYDIALLAPLLNIMVAVGCLALGSSLPVWTLPLLAGLQVFITAACPPGLEAWRLTGGHRLSPPMGAPAQYLQTQ